MYMIIDVNSTGIPTNNNNYLDFNKFDNARLVDLSYVIYDKHENIIEEYTAIVKPIDFVIKNSSFHRITQEHAIEHGLNIEDILQNFNTKLSTVEVIISHNFQFDISIILSECARYNKFEIIENIKKHKTNCTMKLSNLYSSKYLKLTELYKKLFKQTIEQNYNSLDNAKYCAKCYLFIKNQIN